MEPTKVSLKALEVLLAVARLGTLQDGARDLGISISTASHHLSELERTVGTPLLDHSRRPMTLTPAGQILHRRAEEALGSLRKGFSEIRSSDLRGLVRLLRLATIEDFDADVAPALTRALIRSAPRCDLSLLSRPSHEVLDLLRRKKVDLGVAATSDFDGAGIRERPLLRDPFIMVLPAGLSPAPTDLAELARRTGNLPLLRYSAGQLVGQRIEAQLRRLDVHFPRRMEFETTHAILSLVAEGLGWTVTTALSWARAQRYHPELVAKPFPARSFAREISLFARDDVPGDITLLAADTLRASISQMIVGPTVAQLPWLGDRFTVIAPEGSG